MHCQFTTTDLGQGQYLHKCVVCGTERKTTKPRHARECRPDRKPPTLAAQATSLVQWTAAWVKRGARTATTEQYDQRLEICQACPLYEATEKKCGSCGCYLPWKAAGLAAKGKSDCPEGKWPVIG